MPLLQNFEAAENVDLYVNTARATYDELQELITGVVSRVAGTVR